MKEIVSSSQHLILLSTIIVPIITSVLSYFAAVKKTQKEFDIKAQKIKEKTEREILRLEKKREADIEKMNVEHKHQLEILDEKLKSSLLDRYMSDPKELNSNIGELSSALEQISELSDKMNNYSTNKINSHPVNKRKTKNKKKGS